MLRQRFVPLVLVSATSAVPAGWLYYLAGEPEPGDVGAWLIDLGGAMFQCLGAAMCIHVAWLHLRGARSSGLSLIRSFALPMLGGVVGSVVLVELVFLGLWLLVGLVLVVLEPMLSVTLFWAVLLAVGLFGGVFIGTTFLGVRWLVFIPALVAENLGPLQSLGRSWRLVKDRGWWTFGVGVLLPGLLALGTMLMVFWIPWGIGLVFWVLAVTPFLATWCVAVYLDLRAQEAGVSPDAFVEELSRNAE